MNLLLAVADPEERARLEHVLAATGFRVAATTDGAEALARLRAPDRPAIAVVGAELAGADGESLCRQVQDELAAAALPPYLLLLTGPADDDGAAAAAGASADDWLARPFSPAALLARLRLGERLVRLAAQNGDLEERVAQRTVELEHRSRDLARRTEQAMRHQAVLLELAAAIGGQPERALTRVLREDSRTLAIERVSFWSLHTAPGRIACEALYLSTPDRFDRGLELPEAAAPTYFAALLQATVIAADDAQRDPRTREFRDTYLVPNGIGAMLDVPVWVRGRLAGVVCHEHVGAARVWTAEEQDFAVSIGQLAALALETGENRRVQEALRAEVSDLTRRLAAASPG